MHAFEDYFQNAIEMDHPATIIGEAMAWYRAAPDHEKNAVAIQVCNMIFRVAVMHGWDLVEEVGPFDHIFHELVRLHPKPETPAFVEALRSLGDVRVPKRKC